MESVKTKYIKQFFVNEINQKIREILEIKNLSAINEQFKQMPIDCDIYFNLEKYQNTTVKEKFDDLIDKFIGITNLLHMVRKPTSN